MFGKPPPHNGKSAGPPRQAASDVARLQGGGLVTLILTRLDPLAFFLFLNDTAVPQEDVETFLLTIEADDAEGTSGTVGATLDRFTNTVAGRQLQQYQLFPCTIEILARGRRMTVTAARPDSLDGVWINLGLRPDGSASEVSGAKALKVLLTEGIFDAKLTWMDGETEDLFPE